MSDFVSAGSQHFVTHCVCWMLWICCEFGSGAETGTMQLPYFWCRLIMGIYWSWDINTCVCTESETTRCVREQLKVMTSFLHKQGLNFFSYLATSPTAEKAWFIHQLSHIQKEYKSHYFINHKPFGNCAYAIQCLIHCKVLYNMFAQVWVVPCFLQNLQLMLSFYSWFKLLIQNCQHNWVDTFSQWRSYTHRDYSRHVTYSITWRCTPGGVWGDITTIWEVSLVLSGLFSAWNAPHPCLFLRAKFKCRNYIHVENQMSCEKMHVHAKTHMLFIFFLFWWLNIFQ